MVFREEPSDELQNVQSLRVSILDEKKFRQEIPITHVFNIRAFLHAFITCTFCQNSSHQIDNYPCRFDNVLPAHIIVTDHRSYLVSIPIQSLVLNIQILVYSLALQNVACREPFIPLVSILITKKCHGEKSNRLFKFNISSC